ncbi:MAG: NCS2 family permease, partial [Acidobacteria bacterium]|nr:NCS2 family permease [Acidobacteriota bacterium]
FMTMAYIVFVNPAVLAQAGMDFGAVMTATCLAAGIATWAMGIAANYPIALAPAMGQNVFFLTVVAGMGVRWETALAAVFLSGAAFFLLTLCRIRGWLLDAVPEGLKHAIAVGIGLFIAFLGLAGAGIVEKAEGSGLLRLGDLSRAPTRVALAGLLVAAALLARGIRSGVLAGILASAGLAWALGLVEWQGVVAAPPSLAPTFLRLDLRGVLDPALLPIVLLFLFMAMFDAIGTLIGVGEQGGFLRDGRLPRATPALLADSSGTVVGSLLGTSTVTAYVESATGVQAGARTGLANLVTGTLFFLALLFSPVVRMIGGGVAVAGGGVLQPVTAPALVVVGCLMAGNVRRIDWSDFTEGFPAFLVLAGIPFTGSIADGIAFGFIGHPALKALSGRAREIHPLAYALGAVFLLRYVLL